MPWLRAQENLQILANCFTPKCVFFNTLLYKVSHLTITESSNDYQEAFPTSQDPPAVAFPLLVHTVGIGLVHFNLNLDSERPKVVPVQGDMAEEESA